MIQHRESGDFDPPDDEPRADDAPDGEYLDEIAAAERDAAIDRFNTPLPGQKWCPADFVYG